MVIGATVIIRRRGMFLSWLTAAGAEVLATTNPYELVRFKANGSTSVVYRKDNGTTTMTGDAETAWHAFTKGKPWSGGKATKRTRKASVRVQTLRARDGDACFFCGDVIEADAETLEHLVPVAHGGPNHISNLVLAHGDCNKAAGHLSVAEKVRLRDQMRAARSACRCPAHIPEPAALASMEAK